MGAWGAAADATDGAHPGGDRRLRAERRRARGGPGAGDRPDCADRAPGGRPARHRAARQHRLPVHRSPRMTGPAYGVLRPVTPLASVLLAENPSPMTLEGTNSWVLRAPGEEACIVIDPGEE